MRNTRTVQGHNDRAMATMYCIDRIVGGAAGRVTRRPPELGAPSALPGRPRSAATTSSPCKEDRSDAVVGVEIDERAGGPEVAEPERATLDLWQEVGVG